MPFAAAAIGAVATVGGAYMQSQAADKASKRAQATQREAMDMQQEAADRARGDLMPYMDTGQNALFRAGNASGANGPEGFATALGEFQQSPGYQFQMNEGLRALDASASSRGMLASGATQKAAQRYGSGLASQEFGQYYNRLLGITQLGQNSAAGVGAQGIQTANGMAQSASGIAQTQMSAGGAQASIYGNAAQGLGNIGNNYANNALYQQQTNALAPQSGGSGYDWSGVKAGTLPPPSSAGYF